MGRTGYAYVYRDDAHLSGAVVGTRVAMARYEPPWIVVEHALESVLVPRWPGRLLRVRIVEPGTAAEEDAMAEAAQNLRPDAGYTRVIAVDVLEELPAEILFGPHGAGVVRVIERARGLTRADALALALHRHRDAAAGYDAAWQRWLAARPAGGAYLRSGHEGTLLVPGAGNPGSPIGHGLLLISSAVRDAARDGDGDAAFGVVGDADGLQEVLIDPWSRALDTLLDAAMALGAPELLDPTGAAALRHAWDMLTAGDASPTP